MNTTPHTPGPVPTGPVFDQDHHTRLRMYLVICIRQTAWFAVLLTIMQLFYHGYDGSFPLSVALPALVAGIVTSMILGNRQWRAGLATRERRLADGEAAAPVEVSTHSTRTVEIGRSPSALWDRAPSAAAVADHRATVTSVDPTAGTIALKVPISWTSWGRKVLITVHPTESTRTAVTVTSHPGSGSILYGGTLDNGQNAQTVDRLVTWLRELPDAD